MRRTDPAARGFSLMEVTTSLWVISFGLVALLGVFPLGGEGSGAGLEETAAVHGPSCTESVRDAQATPRGMAADSSP